MHPSPNSLYIATWNVEGLTNAKISTLQHYMQEYNIHILCMQEVRKPLSDYFITEQGFLLISSGGDGTQPEFAGVGFLIHPSVRKSVCNFCQYSNRLACLKLRITGGKIAIFSCYAPHQGRAYDERLSYFQNLTQLWHSVSVNGPKLCFGDFNSRLYCRFAAESRIIGNYFFQNTSRTMRADLNRFLMVEFCSSASLCIANTFFEKTLDKTVTYRELATQPMDEITTKTFAELDFLLVEEHWMHLVADIEARRDLALDSHHFIVICSFNAALEKRKKRNSDGPQLNMEYLRDFDNARYFSQKVIDLLCEHQDPERDDLHQKSIKFSTAIHAISKELIPKKQTVARKSWISSASLKLIDHRNWARRQGNYDEEKALQKLIKKSIRNDKSQWLDETVQQGTWNDAKLLRKPRKIQQGRLRNLEGDLVSSESRAETLAEYLEKVQWAKRPNIAVDSPPPLWELLQADCSPIRTKEVEYAVKKLKNGKACGADGIFAEHLKALASMVYGLQQITDLCNLCWEGEQVPESWMLSRVSLIFKKGDPALCENYRPITLLAVGYKLLASILLRRLKDAGAEDRIWQTQYGFRSKCGTTDALFITRRVVEDIWSRANGHGIFLALDWAKAFDSIAPERLADALRRFGIPSKFIKMILYVYSNRQFFVKDMGEVSASHTQHFGISQGCPLSPFLFVILMTILMMDAQSELQEVSKETVSSSLLVQDLLYADDTLLIDDRPEILQAYMEIIVRLGAGYGLAINWKKVECMTIRCHAAFVDSVGNSIRHQTSLGYLGSTIDEKGSIQSELNSRLGMGATDFKQLSKLWNHTNISRKRKYRIYEACVLSKLLYGLQTMWLTKAQRQKLDGFHARCLRRICAIKHAYYSRVSNAAVFQIIGSCPLSAILLERQLKYFGKLYRMPSADIRRRTVFQTDSAELIGSKFKRGRGRPRLKWATELLKHATQIADSSSNSLVELLQNEMLWEKTCHDYCRE